MSKILMIILRMSVFRDAYQLDTVSGTVHGNREEYWLYLMEIAIFHIKHQGREHEIKGKGNIK